VDIAGRPYGHHDIPPTSGRHPVGPVDETGDWNRSHCLSLTASAGYQRWSRLARSIRTSEGNKPFLRGEILASRGPANRRPKGAQSHSAETEHTGGVRVQPHGDSYFLPRKVAGRPVTFLLDSGCTTNLLSCRVFDALPPKERRELASYAGEPGTLADGSRIPFYGIIELTGRVRDQAIQETFVISQLEEDAILGLPFFKRHDCRIDFSKSAILMAGEELACVDKSDCPLVGGVQVVRDCTIPGRSRATIHCRVNDSQISELGVVEGAHARIQLVNSLNRLTERGEILVQCVNPFSEAVKLPSGSVLGRFHSVQEKDIGPSLGDATEGPQQRPSSGRGPSRHTSRSCTRQHVTAARATGSARLWPSCYASTTMCSAAGTTT